MNFYETAVILNPNLSDEETRSAISKITNLITSNGGEVLKVDNWGKRKLAYELNKHKMGFYSILLFKSPPDVIKKLEAYFKVFDVVIKFMVIKLTKHQISALPKDLTGDMPVSPEEVKTQEEV
ncbi:MAG: 30S ribosomal protein S6 [Thermodesulfovibrionales bacterium]|nr:30S ribosomal protein S6 [Thermodesulfovibrionales bacterium]